MENFIRRLMRPHVQTRAAAVAQAVIAIVIYNMWLSVEALSLAVALLGALAWLASAWYSPATSFGAETKTGPRWLDDEE